MGLTEKLAIVVVLLLLLIAMWVFVPQSFSPKCTTDIVAASAALNKSYNELESAKANSKSALCGAYRHHVDVVERAMNINRICGGPWTRPQAEIAFYRRLVVEQCLAE